MSALDLSRFSVWQLMQMDACTRCGECVQRCPTFAEAQRDEITPLSKLTRFRSFAKGQHGGLLARLFGHRPPTEADIRLFSRGAYDCTLCARCRVVCPVHIETRDIWIAMREAMVAQGAYPPLFDTLRAALAEKRNIVGEDNAQRMVWSENLATPLGDIVGRAHADMVYFAGCVSSFYPAVYGITQAFVGILSRMGADFTMLGGEEWCCGFPLHIAGMGDVALELMHHNVQAVRATGAKRLVATCPSCYHTWKHEYPRWLGEPLGFDVIHAAQVLDQWITEGALRLNPLEAKVTYHDPCDLGRASGIYEAPRRVIRAIPGVVLVEMEDHHEQSLCCGGGGDAEMANPELTAAVAKRRLAQAQATGAEYLASACQQCKRTLATAARREKVRIRTLDITELVWQAMR